MRILTDLFVLIAVLFILGCSSTPIKISEANTADAWYSHQNKTRQYDSPVRVTMDKVGLMAVGCWATILVDGQKAVDLSSSGSAEIWVSAGQRIIGMTPHMCKGGFGEIQINAAPDKTTYLRVSTSTGNGINISPTLPR